MITEVFPYYFLDHLMAGSLLFVAEHSFVGGQR